MAKGKAIAKNIAKTVERSADDWVRYAGKEGAKYAEQVGTETAASVISGMAMNGGSKADVLRQMKNLNKGMADDAARAASQSTLSTAADGQMYFGAVDREMMAAERASAKAAKAPREAKVSGRSEVYGQMSFIDKNGNYTGGPGARARNAAAETPAPTLEERLGAFKEQKAAERAEAASKQAKVNNYESYKTRKQINAEDARLGELDDLRQKSRHQGSRSKAEWEAEQARREAAANRKPSASDPIGDSGISVNDVYARFNEVAQDYGFAGAREMAKTVNVGNVDSLMYQAAGFGGRAKMKMNNISGKARNAIDNGLDGMPIIGSQRRAQRTLTNGNRNINITGSDAAVGTRAGGGVGGGANRATGANGVAGEAEAAEDIAKKGFMEYAGDFMSWATQDTPHAIATAGLAFGGGYMLSNALDDD